MSIAPLRRAAGHAAPQPTPAANRSLPDRSSRHLPTAAHHGHLWTLLDGTPAHAPPATLTRDAQGNIACHLCGHWFAHLGAHLRKHGWTADQYRAAVGLALHRPLCSPTLSARLTRRQRASWNTNPDLRRHFEPGRQAARSGELARASVLAGEQRRRRGTTPPEVAQLQHEQLRRGRETMSARRREHLEHIVAAAGHATLGDYLRTEYAAGASLDSLALTTHLGRAALKQALLAAGVAVRPIGMNTIAGKQSRAHRNDAAVAARVGAEDIGHWLRHQHASGATLNALAHHTGRSIAWVRSRIGGTTINDQRRTSVSSVDPGHRHPASSQA